MVDGDGKGTEDDKGPGRPGRGTRPGRGSRGPVLTERQRREAREARKRKGSRSRKSQSQSRNPVADGIRATGRELSKAFAFLGGLILTGLAALAPLGSALVEVLGHAARALGRLLVQVARGISAAGRALDRAIRLLDSVLTPSRAVTFLSVGSALLLVFSQFIDYRAVEIGQPGYAEVLDVATPPQTDGRTPIDEHSYLLVATALVALVGTFLLTRGRRPGAVLVTAAGLLALAVGLLVDLPAGTDASEIASAYSGAEAVLLSGFWLELAAGLSLACCGLLMATAPRAASRRGASREQRPPLPVEGTG